MAVIVAAVVYNDVIRDPLTPKAFCTLESAKARAFEGIDSSWSLMVATKTAADRTAGITIVLERLSSFERGTGALESADRYNIYAYWFADNQGSWISVNALMAVSRDAVALSKNLLSQVKSLEGASHSVSVAQVREANRDLQLLEKAQAQLASRVESVC